MPKIIAKETRNLILHSLAEGMSIRSCERIYGVKMDTVMRYGRLMGEGCAQLLDYLMQKVECKELQADEFWSFIFKKQQNIKCKFTAAWIAVFRGSMARLHLPLSTLRVHPRGRPRITRGQSGWLFLLCLTLSFMTFLWFN